MADRDYMDLLVIESMKYGRRIMVKAPWLSHIEIGYQVEFSNNDGFVGHGTVVSKMDIRKDDNVTLEFLKLLTEIDKDGEIPKVTKYYKQIEVEYDE